MLQGQTDVPPRVGRRTLPEEHPQRIPIEVGLLRSYEDVLRSYAILVDNSPKRRWPFFLYHANKTNMTKGPKNRYFGLCSSILTAAIGSGGNNGAGNAAAVTNSCADDGDADGDGDANARTRDSPPAVAGGGGGVAASAAATADGGDGGGGNSSGGRFR
ncbi:hypothetical protein M0802_001743 [Mischocyttarus mexicanus]|nr:hypothetical protein M0802_001743 [Mischocyttarus mexicanus]